MDRRLTPSPVGWMELCFNHPVVSCSSSLLYYSHVPPLPMLFVYRNELLWHRRQPAVYASEQVCIWWHRTGACYTDKLTFSHSSSIKVWGAYYTNVRIIFEFLRYLTYPVIMVAHCWWWIKCCMTLCSRCRNFYCSNYVDITDYRNKYYDDPKYIATVYGICNLQRNKRRNLCGC